MKKSLLLLGIICFMLVGCNSRRGGGGGGGGHRDRDDEDDSVSQNDSTREMEGALDSMSLTDSFQVDSTALSLQEMELQNEMLAQEELQNRLTVTDLCGWDSYDAVMSILEITELDRNLRALGFEKKFSNVLGQEYNDCLNEYYDVTETVYQRDKYGYKITVKLNAQVYSGSPWVNAITITMPDNSYAYDFCQDAIRNNFDWVEGQSYSGHPIDIYWEGAEFTVHGNVIRMTEISEC